MSDSDIVSDFCRAFFSLVPCVSGYLFALVLVEKFTQVESVPGRGRQCLSVLFRDGEQLFGPQLLQLPPDSFSRGNVNRLSHVFCYYCRVIPLFLLLFEIVYCFACTTRDSTELYPSFLFLLKDWLLKFLLVRFRRRNPTERLLRRSITFC